MLFQDYTSNYFTLFLADILKPVSHILLNAASCDVRGSRQHWGLWLWHRNLCLCQSFTFHGSIGSGIPFSGIQIGMPQNIPDIDDIVSGLQHMHRLCVTECMRRDFIRENQPLAVICGHIHEGKAIDKIGETLVINPGPLQEGNYAWLELEKVNDEWKVTRSELCRLS